MPNRSLNRKHARPSPPPAPVLQELFAAYVASLPAKRRSGAKADLLLFASYLDNYGHELLPPADSRRYRKLLDAEGREHREFCQIFGAERVVAALPMFLSWFVIRKVMADPETVVGIARHTEQLVRWLGDEGHLPDRVAAVAVELARQGADVLRRAQEAAEVLRAELADEPAGDDAELGYFTVVRLAPGKLWLESFETGDRIGPVAVPTAASERLAMEWQISGAVERRGRKWELREVWNVYPELAAE